MSDDVVDGVVVSKGHGHGTHLLAKSIFSMSPPDSFFKILELTGEIPVLKTGEVRCIEGLVPLCIRSMAGDAGGVRSFSGFSVSTQSGWSDGTFEGSYVGHYVGNGLIISQCH